jgi:D-alanyl-D-alanine carboxypeptidase/D-alanyl-D-alanine-endopeptidase (penicillin-binding protein 4)
MHAMRTHNLPQRYIKHGDKIRPPLGAVLLGLAMLAMLVLSPATTTAEEKATDEGPPPLQKQVDSLIQLHAGRFAEDLGVHVVGVRDGKELATHLPDVKRIPASNQKLLTSAVALERLGPEYRFVTAIYRLPQRNGRGDLVVAGTGDPLLGDPRVAAANDRSIYAELDEWAREAKKSLDRLPVGDIRLVIRRRPERYRHPAWPKKQASRWYCAPVASLNFHNNCLDVTWPRNAEGRIAPVIAPASRFLKLVDRTKRSGKRSAWWASLGRADGVVTFRGRVLKPTRHPIPVAVNRPPLLLGRVLADRLGKAGLTVKRSLRRVALTEDLREKTTRIAGSATSLKTVLRRANKRSLNMAAEAMLLRAGDWTWEGSAKRASTVLTRTFGLDANSFTVSDGSGMSRKNRVTPRTVTTLLRAMLKHKGGPALLASLPRSGEKNASLHRRLTQKPYAGRVAAKTGTLRGVWCLSGYVLDAGKRPAVAFSVLVNGGSSGPAKQLTDAIAALAVEHANRE